ncbi:MAG: hypothetical protein MI757_17420, partial [Pirellulales bacterium]|nr:hypothetical protein [Pirellulales bacterium]
MIRLKELCAPDKHFLNAAKGWLELGNPEEAGAELERVGEDNQKHPDVLKARWKIAARRKEWAFSLKLAEELTQLAPDHPSSWICLSFSLFNSGRNREAWSNLIQAAEQFPKVSAIPYFLARLSCKMGNLPEATRWINKWSRMVDKPALK